MSKVVIIKKVSLKFLGDTYKEDYFSFKAIPVREFKKFSDQLENVDNDPEKSIVLLVDILKDRFVDGKFQGEELGKEDIEDLDVATLTKCFTALTGQDDLKGMS